jgi:hypothetical protein
VPPMLLDSLLFLVAYRSECMIRLAMLSSTLTVGELPRLTRPLRDSSYALDRRLRIVDDSIGREEPENVEEGGELSNSNRAGMDAAMGPLRANIDIP